MKAAAPAAHPRYRRVLLKLSGEALMGGGEYGLDDVSVTRIAAEVMATAGAGR